MKQLIALLVVALIVSACSASTPEELEPTTSDLPQEDLTEVEAELSELDNLDAELNLDEELENLDLSLE